MAESLHDGEFWLPSKFLTDDDTVMEKYESEVKNTKLETVDETLCVFPYEFPYEFGVSSDSSSPVESVVGSTETESDEDDLLAEITREIACTKLGNKDETTKGSARFGSPQSTLSPTGSGFGHRQVPTRVCSWTVNWDSVYAGAGEVARTRMQEESAFERNCNGTEMFGRIQNPCPLPVPVTNSQPNIDATSLYQQQLVAYQKLQAFQLRQQLNYKQPQQQQQQSQFQGLVRSRMRGNARTMDLSASAWPSLLQAQQQQQQQRGRAGSASGMTAVFMGSNGRKSECAGTGVFLPRHVGTPTESRKKPGSSTVILPAKVVKALNLNLGELGPPRFQLHAGGSFALQKDLDLMASRNRGGSGSGSQHRRVPKRHDNSFHPENMLPKEWTY